MPAFHENRHWQFSERSITEAQAVAALKHPSICMFYDIGPDSECLWCEPAHSLGLGI
jgi:hypothetical protein